MEKSQVINKIKILLDVFCSNKIIIIIDIREGK